jgi:hypothetical protein
MIRVLICRVSLLKGRVGINFMNAPTVKYFWGVVTTGLISSMEVDFDNQHSRMFDENIELPQSIEDKLNEYFFTHKQSYLVQAAIDAVKSFRLTSIDPESHLVLVAFLLVNNFITVNEACMFSQIDTSNFSLMSEEAQDIVRLTETVDEEQKMGFKKIDSDDFLKVNLLEFAQQKGYVFSNAMR